MTTSTSPEARLPGSLRGSPSWPSSSPAARSPSSSSAGRGDLTACRTAAWKAIPRRDDLPDDWALGSTDLNANGMTISIARSGTRRRDDEPAGRLRQRDLLRRRGRRRRSTRTARGGGRRRDGRDPRRQRRRLRRRQPGDGRSITTLFRVGGLVGQVADGGTTSPTELATITSAVAAAMGDKAAAGTAAGRRRRPERGASSRSGRATSAPAESAAPPFAPELEALLPRP